MIGYEDPRVRFFVNRGIWLFCSQIEGNMDKAADKVKGAKQAESARYGELMKALYPNDPSKRFRNPGAPKGSAGPAIAGESFFDENEETRSRRD